MKLTGVMPPITTPFEGGEVALERLKENFQKWNQTGLSGYLVLGSNGESVYLNEREKLSGRGIQRGNPLIKAHARGNGHGIHPRDHSVLQSSCRNGC
jgi:hypothetical protein